MAQHALNYPFADAISPYAAEMEALTRKWLQEDYTFLPDLVKQRYIGTQTGMLTARFFPLAPRERLVPLSMCSLWGLAFDDYYEDADLPTYQSLRKNIGAIIRGEQALAAGSNVFLDQMNIIAGSLRKIMPGYWMGRFALSMETYIDGMAEESLYKKTMEFPSPDIYTSIRWKSVDVLQMIDGLEVATGRPLPDQVRHHPHIEKMAWLTCRIIAWCNDYFSVAKENGRDVMNLVLVLQNAAGVSLQEATQQAVRIHDEDLANYLELSKTLPDFGPDTDALRQFLEYNNLMIAGHARWYITDTHRYKPGGGPDKNAFKGISDTSNLSTD